jgi:ribosomal protein S18 acetylase RimI-like enzyme
VTIEIVEAGVERLDELEPLWHALVQHHAAVAVGLGEPRERADIWERRRRLYEELLAKDGTYALIAERDGAPVGYAMVSLSRPSMTWPIDRAANLETIAVLPEARGAGIGTRLVDAVKERMRAAGVTHLGLGVVATNDAAIRFYRRHGFEPAFVEMIARIRD